MNGLTEAERSQYDRGKLSGGCQRRMIRCSRLTAPGVSLRNPRVGSDTTNHHLRRRWFETWGSLAAPFFIVAWLCLSVSACQEAVQEHDLLVGDWEFAIDPETRIELSLYANGDATYRIGSTIHDTTSMMHSAGTWRRDKDRLMTSMSYIHGRRIDPPIRWDSTIMESTANLLCLSNKSWVPGVPEGEDVISAVLCFTRADG